MRPNGNNTHAQYSPNLSVCLLRPLIGITNIIAKCISPPSHVKSLSKARLLTTTVSSCKQKDGH